MKTAFCVNGHVNGDGTVMSDEPVPLPAGPVEIVVQQCIATGQQVEAKKPSKTWEQITQELEALRKAHGPVGKRKRMSDIDEDIYGPKAPFRE